MDNNNRVVDYSFSTEEPETGVYIRGESVYSEWSSYISYPQIEQYFVPEGKGWAIDRMGRVDSNTKLEVIVLVGAHGKAQVINLLANGEPIDFATIESENPYVPVKPVEPAPEPTV